VLKKSPIQHKFIPFIYRGNYYLELWMPISLIAILFLIIKLVSLATMAAIWLVVILVLFEFFTIAYLFITPVLAILREHAKYKDAKAKLKPLDVIRLVNVVDEFSTKRYRMDLIYTALEKQYLISSPVNLSRLRILIAFLQTILASQYSAQNFTYLVEIDKDLAHTLGYVDQNNYKVANYWDEDQLDLFCKMLEQLRQVSIRGA
jgi:ABC-type transport system involved in Fe-S cluster assembly fused permease/ATPase subunit